MEQTGKAQYCPDAKLDHVGNVQENPTSTVEGVTHTITGRGSYTHHHRQKELHTPSQAEGVTHTITGRGSYTHHHRQKESHTPPQAETHAANRKTP